MSLDRLPPHSIEAEQGILAALLMDPSKWSEVEERFKGDQFFYDLRHSIILRSLVELRAQDKAIDLISLQQQLKDVGDLEKIGGISYLCHLTDGAASPENLSTYLDIAWEKWIARQAISSSTEIVSRIYDEGGMSEPLLERVRALQQQFEAKSQRAHLTPKYLKSAGAFEADYFARFFGGLEDEPGWSLPIGFPLKIRLQENTLVSGDDGAGKSTFLSYIALHLAQAGCKICMASLEMPPGVSTWILASQLLGTKKLPDSDAGRAQAARALAWIHHRVSFYDFLGIADWRDVLDTFRYAARHGFNVFLLDSVMRIGLADDDYAGQGLASAHFAQFCIEYGTHLFYVIHENKSDARGKAKVRGSKLWTANACNILHLARNQDKETKRGEYEEKLKQAEKEADEEDIRKYRLKIASAREAWDSHLALQKQRYPGTRQNGSAFIWFDRNNFQFRDCIAEPAVNWLQKWKG